MKSITLSLLTLLATLLLGGCGGGKRTVNTTDEVSRQNDSLAQAITDGRLSEATNIADKMSLYVDDLTPDEVVNVLLTFLEVHNSLSPDARAAYLENMRKYVDVYDIAVSMNPADMRAAFARARAVNPEIDFARTADDFRRGLAEYDAVKTYGETPVVRTDSVPLDSLAVAARDSVQPAGTPEELEPSYLTD